MPGVHSINDLPWIPFAAKNYIETMILKPDSRVFEYGSGGSTVWLAGRCGFLVTVENRVALYEEVAKKLKELGRQNKVDYLLRSKGPRGFKPYITAIDDYEEDFDVVFVDGRERAACMTRAKPRIKPGGYLILDNPDEFPPPRGLFEGWEVYNFYAYGWSPTAGGIRVEGSGLWPCVIYRNVDWRNCQEL